MCSSCIAIAAWIIIATSAGGLTALAVANRTRTSPKVFEPASRS
jgi:hypothetical protein